MLLPVRVAHSPSVVLASRGPGRGSALAEVSANPAKPKSPYTSNAPIKSKFLCRSFLPDGDLIKDAWKEAKWVQFSHDAHGGPNYPEAMTEVASRWTAEYIYFAFRCKYTALNIFEGEDVSKERWELWNRPSFLIGRAIRFRVQCDPAW